MSEKIIQLKEAQKFARENGYLLAVYNLIGNNYKLYMDCYDDDPQEDTPIIIKTTGAYTDMNEFTTQDKQFCFRLHNNFNLPKLIPYFQKELKGT